MAWYLDKTRVTHLGSKRLRLLYKYLLTNIRNVSHLVRRPHRSCQSICSSQSTRRIPLKSHRSKKTIRLFGAISSNMKYENVRGLQMYRLYSTSSRETFKAEAPIGVYQHSRTTFRLRLLGLRLGESFNHLSRHINLYFKQKQVSVIDYGQGGLMSAVQEPLTRTSRRVQRERRTGESRAFVGTPAIEQVSESSSHQPLTSAYPGLQLFHISSLANRFGESYIYVANHINSVFSRNPAKQIHMEVSPDDGLKRSRSRKRRVMNNKSGLCRETAQTKQNISMGTRPEIDNNVSSSWDEGYLHFARHINRYFGAKVADTVEKSPHTEMNILKTSVSLDTLNKPKDPLLQPKSPGLFHMSSLTTRFGENYTYMANHVNRYFKGSAASENEEVDGELNLYRGSHKYTVIQEKTVSFFECLLKPSTIPGFVGSYLGMGSSRHSDQTTTVTRTPEEILDKTVLRRRKADEMTRVLLKRLEKATVQSSITSCVEELNAHLIQHPACKAVVWQEKAAMQLLRCRRTFWMNEKLQEVIRETLALIGYVDPVRGCGVRVLSIDGGGTKGLVPLQVLKQLEAQTGKRVYQLFDYICGVSTGAVLAFMLGLAHISLDECEEMYHRFGSDVFRQNPLVGTVKMGWTHSYYSTETWEMILREKLGEEILIKTARDELSPKVSAVSAVVNWGKSPKAFIFRNYNHAPGRLSRYAGGSGYRLWQAVRASSAAPGYFQEFPLHGDIHQDGGLILNNPCALAVHESRLLWPSLPFQCVLSLGTGRYDNARRGPATSTSLRAKISNLICSATDTEGVHTLLDDLLSPNVYFRFNPMLSSNVTLDESRPEVLHQLQKDTQLYLDRNRPKLERLCEVLMTERSAIWKTRDWIGGKAWELQQRWA
ncbi:calcium-independent phospholipase A2-gamma-like [Sinocyclocheilus grahami]|uniref:Neurofascin n=1 Tax=Sinocyclocheilus grahami TaxID=75366 RepID=A0A672MSI5_SINGR|nr:PREDICTED: calcium-independent phospholipase A2-gamma-like [Sinocyclocheilus grahami]XP_016100676.1 PREDICTED: calcium-independent phospholipase A2-gamma-like [Sinocyclocheilus grahami]